MITTLLSFLTAFATGLVFAGAVWFAYGWIVTGLAIAAIGAGWLGIVYSFLLQNLGH